jgi:hypothetical protein
MPGLIDSLQKKGFTLVTVSELIASAKKINNHFIDNKTRKKKMMEKSNNATTVLLDALI